MTASPVFSRVARMAAGPTIYTSGLYGASRGNGGAETREIFEHLRELLGKTGSDFKHLVKATYYVSSDEAGAKLNDAMGAGRLASTRTTAVAVSAPSLLATRNVTV